MENKNNTEQDSTRTTEPGEETSRCKVKIVESVDDVNGISRQPEVLDEDALERISAEDDVDVDEYEGDDADYNNHDEMEYMPTLIAEPPKFSLGESQQLEVSSSPAFSILDQLIADGTLTATKSALLKAQYSKFHEELKIRRCNEQNLLRQAKDSMNTLEQQKKELSLAEEFPDHSDTEVTRLRTQLLQYNNDIQQTLERNYQLNYRMECLMEDKKMLQKEAERLPKPGEFNKKGDDLKQSCTDLNKEINQRKQEIKTLKEDLDNIKRQHQLKSKDTDVLKEQENNLQSDLAAIYSEPQSIQKEGERLQRRKNECEKNCKEVGSQIKNGRLQLINLQTKVEELDGKKLNLERNAREKNTLYFEKEKTLQILTKDLNYAMEKETMLHGDRVALDININQISQERNTAHDMHARKLREKDGTLKVLKKAELQLKVAEESLERLQQARDKLQLQKNSVPKDDGSRRRKIEELRKEVDQTARALAAQSGLSAEETLKLEQSIAAGERLIFELNDLKVEIVELTRLAAIKTEEKIQKGRDLKQAEQHFFETKQELVTKNIVIDDNRKREQELLTRLKEFAKLYNVIKNERNKCVSLIQTSNQKAAEMKEKIKILQNEIEILRTSLVHKDRQLQKFVLKNVHGVVSRDTLRNEVCKKQKVMIDLKAKREHNIMSISHLESLIKKCEDEMIALRKRYELEVKSRNERGIQLVERNQEVCIFYEKLNIQDQIMRNGHVELLAREDDIRILKLKLSEEKRAIELLRKGLPNKRAIEQELVTLQIQLSQCQDSLAELELQVENPTEDRIRFIEGKVLTPIEIQEKLEKLEERLASKEAQLLEKELIADQVNKLTEQVYKEVGSGKEDTLILAKKVNNYQWHVSEMTRRMKATVSELSMHQANALRLQQEVREKEAELEDCYRRMEQGLAPSWQMEQEWQKLMRAEQSRPGDRGSIRVVDEDDELLLDGPRSRAEPRPNAYLPADKHELAIPRPYGGHAPFKPTQPGSTMRHIRRPVPKQIEL